jgi:hypothetical protein
LIEIYTGSLGTIYLTTYKDGVPVGPDNAPTVVIVDAETGTSVASGSATLVDSDYEGEYQYVLPTSATSIDRVLKATWTYVISSKTQQEVEYIYVNTPYATVDEIMSELGHSSHPQDPNYFPYDKVKSAERVARMMVNDYLGFELGKYAGTIVAYGDGADTIILPSKMISFTKLTENDKTVIDTTQSYNQFGYDVEITETGYALRIIPTTPGDDISEQEYYDILNIRSGQFKNGYRYEVTGVVGWNYIPVEIKQSMFLLVNDLLCSDSTWRTKYVKKIDSGQMSVELSSLTFNGTGNAIVDSILQKFKSIQAVVI